MMLMLAYMVGLHRSREREAYGKSSGIFSGYFCQDLKCSWYITLNWWHTWSGMGTVSLYMSYYINIKGKPGKVK